ncbi:hypothetical protein [Acetobacter peroxydans]|jgi:hypothetical protein|uniref:hypothetical protein n=1 Tax=Acetobacter peroxydans TaxID=104098 RepID=UPI00235393F4|nr:hypothetical protein [Acetobacter peroxydans]MCH4143184.1 hypothetical protein [Acetobacter peroxydans]MCI1394037.1 hypothetical protein [Acetobacter peroxydans]MCI1411651.1 hypothetical protein [Acetobacter peroxydans]MCI1439297.1 hypothetical protein [Acetobacter peroxydans]MCI1566969.1 hypothetical protein [Acetobacter peroxydans]
MKSTDDRKLFDTLIGASAATGNIATIPATQGTAGDGTASIALAFPPETFIARAAGGEPPRGADMNGFLNLLSSAVQVLQAGYFGPFDATFAAGIGGYPAGAIVAGSAAGAFWVSTADANTTVPGAAGASWKSLFDGYATQDWATGQFVSSTLFSDTNNIGAAYFGYRTDLGYAWMNYKNSAGAYAPVVLADRTWVNGSFATLSGLADEAAARSSADTTLAQAITNETTRAEEAEAQKANLAGGNSWSGTQNFGDDVVVAAGYKVFIEASGGAGSCYIWPEYYASGNLAGLNAVTHVLDSSGNSLAWLALNGGNGRLYTSTGSVAFLADMPKAAIINSSNPNATGVSGSLSFTAARAGFLKLDVSSSNSGTHKVSTASVSGTGYTSISGGYNAPEDMLAGSYIVVFAAGAAVTINVAVTYDGTSATNYLNSTGVIVYNA